MTETFKASVQYNDLLGSVAADRADSGDARTWLEQNGHLRAGEFLIGMDVYVRIPGGAAGSDVVVDVSFVLVQAANFESAVELLRTSSPAPVRKLSLEFTAKDFFSFFKRFNLTLSSSGELEGCKYDARK
ncbi:hypothetical protein GGR75_004053 [Xanthomonas campestris]|uniref:hypothetical protein n=1 Tax=Xanthomonas campestris TaxID=339 RepID=UPI001CD4AEED|nr:hypothetical protein [Xanthomonas campestris]MEA9797159.1 hypothetical protein [Xanthomonas campestris pv. raphani]MEC5197489.1 hypothetical protein [Xanthomonas campestris]